MINVRYREMNEMMKLEFKVSQILALNYKTDVTNYRERIEFLKNKLEAAA